MIRQRACRRGHRLRDVQPVHLGLRLADAASVREIPGVANAPGTGAKHVRIQRDHDLGTIEAIVRAHGRAERDRGTGQHLIVVDRFVLVPASPAAAPP